MTFYIYRIEFPHSSEGISSPLSVLERNSMKRVMRALLGVLLPLLAGVSTCDPTVVVCSAVPGGTTIQECVDHVVDGGTILVAPGTYYENIVIKGRTLFIYSTEGDPAQTVINGSSQPGSSVISITNSSVEMSGFTITGGSRSDEGGGISAFTSDVLISYSIVRANVSDEYGGGIFSYKGSLTILDTVIEDNHSGPSEYGYGGGIYAWSQSSIHVERVIIRNNSVGTDDGGGIHMGSSPQIVLRDVLVEGNHGWDGGGIYIAASPDFLFERLVIQNNIGEVGAGVVFNNAQGAMRSSVIQNNTCNTLHGCGVYAIKNTRLDMSGVVIAGNSVSSDRSTTQYGGGIYADTTSGTWNNITVADNEARGPGGIYIGKAGTSGPILLTNSVVAFNAGGNLKVVEAGALISSYNTFYNPATHGSNITWEHDYSTDVGFAERDPQFVCAGDYNSTQVPPVAACDYTLQEDSLEIDSGDPNGGGDPADPLDPTQALWPSQGSTLPDRGAFGGPDRPSFDFENPDGWWGE